MEDEAEEIVCTRCNKSFSTIQKLCDHSELHDIESYEDQVACPRNKDGTFNVGSSDIINRQGHHVEKVCEENNMWDVEDKDMEYLECEICGELYYDKIHVLIHEKAHKTGFFECPICEKRFCVEAAAFSHYVTHLCGKPYICKICGSIFKEMRLIKSHYVTHAYKNRCRFCRKSFENIEKLKEHRVSGDCTKIHSCHGCGSSYLTYATLVQHLQNCPCAKYFACKMCGTDFASPEKLKLHMLLHEDDSVKPYLFPSNGAKHRTYSRKKTNSKPSLPTSSENKSFVCKTCGLFFPSAEILECHISGHINDQKLMLSCIKKEQHSESKMSEMVLESPSDVSCEYNHFPCKVCGINYPSKTLLESHMPTHGDNEELCLPPNKTGVVQNTYSRESAQNPQVVEKVESVFSRKYISGDRGWACCICGVVFKRIPQLKSHLLLHGDLDKLSDKLPRKIVGFFAAKKKSAMQVSESSLSIQSDEKLDPSLLTSATEGKKESVKRMKIGESSSLTVSDGEKSDSCLLTSMAEKVFPCDICGVRLQSLMFLESHLMLHDKFQHS